jgi:murein DD-endopeptidase MepM/ murein hydrolase activator NlpD
MDQRHATTRKIVTALCAVLMLLPAATVLAADPDPEQRLDEVRDQIGEVQEGLQEVERQRVVTIEDLQEIDGQLAVLDSRLAELTSELRGAEQGLAAVEQQLAVTTSELLQTEQELADTEDRLEGEREVFAARTRASFMYGGPSLAGAMVEAESMADLARSVHYVQRVMESDRDRINVVSGLVRQVEAQTEDLEALRSRQTAQRAEAQTERDRVAVLVAEEQSVRDLAASERQKRQLVLNQLDADRDSHIALANSLEQESARLEDELRRRAEEEARRIAEAEAAAEEARRVAAAEAASRQAEQSRQSAASAPAPQEAQAPAPAAPTSTGRMQRPADGRVTSGYGWRTHPIFGTQRFHSGTDFGGGHGAPIYAADSGVVVSASARGGYGNTIVLDHGGGLTTLYAHQSRFAVSGGQTVTRGQVIGYIGSTGYSTGPHLHWEVRVNGSTRDPMTYL